MSHRNTRATLKKFRNESKVFYYHSGDFSAKDENGNNVWQDYVYGAPDYVNHGDGFELIGNPVSSLRGNIVNGNWSVNTYSDKECTLKNGEINWMIIARAENPELGFGSQILKTTEHVSILSDDQTKLSGLVHNKCMGGYYEVNKKVKMDVEHKVLDNFLEKDVKEPRTGIWKKITITNTGESVIDPISGESVGSLRKCVLSKM